MILDDGEARELVARLLDVEPSEVLSYVMTARIQGKDDSSALVVTQASHSRDQATILLISGMQVLWDGIPHPLNDEGNTR